MTRHAPIQAVGQARVFGPTERCRSFRLRWTEPDGTPGDTTAGSDPGVGIAKATALDRRLSRAAGPAAMTPLGEIFTQYLAEGCSPYSDRPWRSSTRTSRPGCASAPAVGTASCSRRRVGSCGS